MVQYTLGALAGAFVGLYQDGTALPMVLTMSGCALAGSFAFLLAMIVTEHPVPAQGKVVEAAG